MVCCAAKLLCKALREILLDGFNGRSVRKSYASGYSEHMRVHSDNCFAINDRGDHIGSLSSDSGQFFKLRRFGWDNAVEIGNEHGRHSDKMFCLVVWERYRFYEFVHLFERCCCKVCRIGVSFKDDGRVHIDALVGALR